MSADVRSVPIIDGHTDYLLSLTKTGRSFLEESSIGHVDLPRARRGNVGAMLSAVYLPGEFLPQHALSETLRTVDLLKRIVVESNGQMELVRSHRQLVDCLERGVFGAILHYEGAEAIDPDFAILRLSYELGLRSLGLVWSRPTIFAEGVGPTNEGRGLTGLGRELVRECNRMGILIDVSHLNEPGFWDVVEVTERPFVASHSNVRVICDHERNLTDEQIKALAGKGGLMGINYAVGFLVEGAKRGSDVPLSVLVDHIDYIVHLVGIDYVALGSDYDGAGVPESLKDVAHDGHIVEELARRGYDDAAIAKICRDNWLRVLGAVWTD
ncbi:MAG TPA: dipeptidase [Thermomicrobiaceae bacterium]|nr:dipeptidase [Thermomicrobiaceae bacterium]